MAETRRSYGFSLSIAAGTDVGRVRTNNEDSYGHAWLEEGSLFAIVADGMGGHEAGEVASGLAVQVVEEMVSQDAEGDPRERLHDALLEANRAILEEGQRSGTRGMGTTSITAVFKGQEVFVALIGDSRCYHIRRGQMLWRTLDHTRVQMLIDNGEITEEEARVHPEAGMLTRALGHDRMADGRPLEPDVLTDPLWVELSDALVLCSDGLHDLVEDWEIGQMVAGKTSDEAVQALIDMACERGGHDNVTVTVVIGGERAAEYDPNYVPEYYHDLGNRDYTGEDYDTNDTYDEPDTTEQAVSQAAAPQYVAGAGGPGNPVAVVATTGVIGPEILAQVRGDYAKQNSAAPVKSSKLPLILGVVGVGMAGLFLLTAVVIVAVLAYFRFAA